MCSRGAQIVLEILLQAIRTVFTQLWRKYFMCGWKNVNEGTSKVSDINADTFPFWHMAFPRDSKYLSNLNPFGWKI